MLPKWLISVALTACAFGGCATTETAVAPLGFGPLAKAEQTAQERLASHGQDIDTKKPRRRLSPSDPPSIASGDLQNKVDKPANVFVAESPAPAASVATAQFPATPSKLADWLGLWHGKDTTRYLIPSFPPQPMDDPNARIRVESSGSQQVSFILIDSTNEKDLCSLSAHVEANQAKFDPGQPCFGNEEDSSNLSVHLKSGTGTLSDTALVVDLTLDAEVQSEQFQANGSVEYHFEGKR